MVQEMEKDKVYENIQATNNVAAEAKVSKKKGKAPPTLAEILNTLEQANSQPSRALDHLKHLALSADEIV